MDPYFSSASTTDTGCSNTKHEHLQSQPKIPSDEVLRTSKLRCTVLCDKPNKKRQLKTKITSLTMNDGACVSEDSVLSEEMKERNQYAVQFDKLNISSEAGLMREGFHTHSNENNCHVPNADETDLGQNRLLTIISNEQITPVQEHSRNSCQVEGHKNYGEYGDQNKTFAGSQGGQIVPTHNMFFDGREKILLKDGNSIAISPIQNQANLCGNDRAESFDQMADVLVAAPLSVDMTGDTFDDVTNSLVVTPHDAESSLSAAFIDDLSSSAEVTQSDHSQLHFLPDIIASHYRDTNSFSKPNDFFCFSSESDNFVQLCPSSSDGSCPKRSALIFPDMVADVGGCLCSNSDRHQQLSERLPDLFSAIPDLIISHGYLVSENWPEFEMTAGKTILVTGGAGYIGSHAVVELIEAGYDIVVIDNLINASMESIRRVEKIVGKKVPSYSVDLLNKPALEEIFKKHTVSAVIHFAGLKAVGESCELPLLYYKTNVGGTTNLLEVMESNGVFNLVFSSSATVYGPPQFLPISENHPVGGCTNPYGKTKFMIEQILNDLTSSNKNWNIIILRYFNPVGAHISGTIGEDPSGVPNNLMPYIGQVAVGRRAALKVYGSDYDTPDGTGVRDYIHVVDLAQGHVAAVGKLGEQCGLKVYNLGTGQGCSVLDMVKAFEKASGKKIPYELADRRPGDVASMYGDPTLASKELNWKAKRGLDQMCEDLWRWQSQNPKGYNIDSTE